VVNLQEETMRDRILTLTGGRGADVFVDPVGGEVFEQSMRCIAPGGRILIVGFTSGVPASARTNLILVKMISVIGVEARLAVEKTNGEGMADFQRMLTWIAEGRIVPHVGKIYPFEKALEGFDDLMARRHLGKSVIRVDASIGS
jgi:NADPH2:quinone reductase